MAQIAAEYMVAGTGNSAAGCSLKTILYRLYLIGPLSVIMAVGLILRENVMMHGMNPAQPLPHIFLLSQRLSADWCHPTEIGNGSCSRQFGMIRGKQAS
jgi:hypothetical protein